MKEKNCHSWLIVWNETHTVINTATAWMSNYLRYLRKTLTCVWEWSDVSIVIVNMVKQRSNLQDSGFSWDYIMQYKEYSWHPYMGSNQDLPITGQKIENRIRSGTMFTECFKTMKAIYLKATGQTRATPNIQCYIRHKVQAPCTSGLIAVVILFNRKSSAYQTNFRGKSELRFVFSCFKFPFHGTH